MIVYKITNLLSGKIYVGQTVRTLEKRINQHKRRTESAISQAIKKYGWENFSAEVLEECETQKQIDEREMFWIAKLDCISPKGYNLNEGGSGGRTPTDETRKKQSESAKRRFQNPDEHLKMSMAQRIRFADSAEHEKLSKAQKKYFNNPERKCLNQRKILHLLQEQICLRHRRGVFQSLRQEQRNLQKQKNILKNPLKLKNIWQN